MLRHPYLILALFVLLVPLICVAEPVTVSHGATTHDLSDSSAKTSRVSLNFQDADIRNVLKVLAFKSGVNIVAAPDVTGIVNMELMDVPWQEALDVILSTYGYGFEQKDRIIIVMTNENLEKYREHEERMRAQALALQSEEPLISKTFILSYATAEDVIKVLDKWISKRGVMNFDDRTNSILIRDTASSMDLIFGVIKSIDTVTPQVMIETRIIETDLNNEDALGIDWVLKASISGSSRPTTFPFTETKNGILGSGGPYTPNDITSFSLSSASSSNFTYGTINASTLSATLQVLGTRSTTKILSNPKIVTLDNQKAKINVGIEYPEATYSFNSSTGQQQVTGFTQLPIGVNFEVTPHVNNARMITMELHPQISALKTTVTVDNNALPETSNEEAITKVMVEDGATLVIGGLITDQVNVNKTKVPILGDIPWLGKLLFQSTDTTKIKQEILIFLTPHIITAGKSSN